MLKLNNVYNVFSLSDAYRKPNEVCCKSDCLPKPAISSGMNDRFFLIVCFFPGFLFVCFVLRKTSSGDYGQMQVHKI